MKTNLGKYSYRNDKSVPDFPDIGPVCVMDAQCALCAKGARWIARNDRSEEFRIFPVQSAVGQALLRHFVLNPEDPKSWLYLSEGQAYTSMDAVIRVGTRLGGRWRFLQLLRLLPRSLQDWLYGHVARNRYRFFGRTDMCSLPDAALQKRLWP